VDVRHRQRPSGMPIHKYTAFPAVDLPDRSWPTNRITVAPRWLSTDLRDGNQALIDPMTPARKRRMFDLLVGLGYKEIEVGFPSASQTDFDFVRALIERDVIPDDVRISVLTQAREELIERTIQSLVGAREATVHLYNATAPVFRRVVFGWPGDGREQCRTVATEGTAAVMKYAEQYLGDCDFGYEYSPEIFMDTFSETPARTMLRIALRRKSCKRTCTPAALAILSHVALKSKTASPLAHVKTASLGAFPFTQSDRER